MSDQANNMEAALSEAWGDWVPPVAYDDAPNWRTHHRAGQWISRPQDRERGKFAPFFQTEQDLAMIRGQARWLAGFNEVAIGAIGNLTNYILGTGFAYEAAPIEGVDGGEQAAKVAQAIIDEFHRANDWRQLERELFERSIIDGEYVAVVEEHDGGALIKIAEPDYLTEPMVTADLDEMLGHASLDWLFGVASHWNNTCARVGYFLDWEGRSTNWEVYPAWKVEHFRRNVPRGVKRGLSDLYAVEQWLERAYKVLRNTAEGAAIQASIAYVKEHAAGTSAAQATSLAGARLNTANLQKPALRGGTSPITAKKFGPGTILDLSNGQKFVPGPMGSERAPNFIAIQQAVLRAVGSRWSMPEYMISGDASNANYASTLVAESPFVKNAETEQVLYSESFDAIHWKVLRIAYGAGRFSHLGMSWEEIRRAITIDITPPPVATRNRLEDTQVRSVLHDKGILSPKTWSALEELEFEVEQENLKDYAGNTPTVPPSPLAGTQPAATGIPQPTTESQQRKPVPDHVRKTIDELWEGYP